MLSLFLNKHFNKYAAPPLNKKYFYENVISAESEYQLPCPHHPRAEGHGGEGGGADPAHQGAGLHRCGPHLQVGERVQCS